MIFIVTLCSLLVFSCKKVDSIRNPVTKEIPPKADTKTPPVTTDTSGGTKTPATPVPLLPADTTLQLDDSTLKLTASGTDWNLNVIEVKDISKKNLIIKTYKYHADKKMILNFKDGQQLWSISDCSQPKTNETSITIKGKQINSVFSSVSDLVLEENQDILLTVAISNSNCKQLSFNFEVRFSFATVVAEPAEALPIESQKSAPVQAAQPTAVQTSPAPQPELLTVNMEEFLSSNQGLCSTFSCLLHKMNGNIQAKQDPNDSSGMIREYVRNFGPGVTLACTDKFHPIASLGIWKSKCTLTVNPALTNDAVVIRRGPSVKSNLISIDIAEKNMILSITNIFPTIYNTMEKVEVNKTETEKVSIPRLNLTCYENSTTKKLLCNFLGVLN